VTGVDFFDDALEIGAVTLVVKVREMHEPMRGLVFGQPQFPDPEPLRFDPQGIRRRRAGRRAKAEQDEPSPVEFLPHEFAILHDAYLRLDNIITFAF